MRFAALRGYSVAALLAALPLPAEAFPSRGIGEIRVKEARIVADTAKGSQKRISIVFYTNEEPRTARVRFGLGYVAARLTDCENGDASAMEVIDQSAEYLIDRGWVSSLGRISGGRWRYRVLFDDGLAQTVDHRSRFTPSQHDARRAVLFAPCRENVVRTSTKQQRSDRPRYGGRHRGSEMTGVDRLLCDAKADTNASARPRTGLDGRAGLSIRPPPDRAAHVGRSGRPAGARAATKAS